MFYLYGHSMFVSHIAISWLWYTTCLRRYFTLILNKIVDLLVTNLVINKSLFKYIGLVWFVGFYGISTFVGYLTPNPFLCE